MHVSEDRADAPIYQNVEVFNQLTLAFLNKHVWLEEVAARDEIWFNPGDDNFYLGIGGPPAKLGVVDANDDHVVTVISGKGGHSVAAYAGNNHIFDPDRNGTGIAVFVSNH